MGGQQRKYGDHGGMKTIRVMAAGAVVLLAIYFAFRALARQCTGSACDAFIPVSLLIPLAIFVLVALTGTITTIRARSRYRWFGLLLALTAVSVFGPPIALLIFRDRPDGFVLAAAVLELPVPAAVFAYSFLVRPGAVQDITS